MTVRRWSQAAGSLLLLGSVAWLAKFAVIVASDGRIIDTGAAAWLLRAGLVCLLLGATGLALWLTRQRGTAVRLVAILAAPIVFIGSFLILDTLASAVVGTRGPVYLASEAGIVVAAAVWLLLGIWLLLQIQQAPPDTVRAVHRA